jgi:hypothetical protein
MPNITKINSAKGLVTFTREELADLDLLRWVRADSKGVGNRDFISVQPIEKAAAHVFVEKYPSVQIKLAEKCFMNEDGSVDVILRVAQDVSDGYYKKHPTKLTFMGDVKAKEQEVTFNKKMERDSKKSSGLSLPIDFLEDNLDKLSNEEKRQIFAELGKENSETFLEDLRIAMLDAKIENIEKLAKELSVANGEGEETDNG